MNKEFLAKDRTVKSSVTTAELRGSLKGAFDLVGKRYRNHKAIAKKLAPSTQAAAKLIKRAKNKR
jgi:hypothetical protein